MSTQYELFKAFYKTSSFWQGQLAGLMQFPLSNFHFKDLNEEELLELPNIPPGTVLGKRAEYFFEFCAVNSSNYEVLAANLQIFKGKQTIGEIDYLLHDRERNRDIHIELVYKFYIYEVGHKHTSAHFSQTQNKELSRYVGPNRRDYFLKKFDHLKDRQLPLIHQEPTVEALSELGIKTSSLRQYVCFLAHVFIPRELWNHSFPYINRSCIKGYYMDESAFAKARTTNTYYLPEKKQWKFKPMKLMTVYSYDQAHVEITKSLKRGFAPLVWMELENGGFEAFFVVADLASS